MTIGTAAGCVLLAVASFAAGQDQKALPRISHPQELALEMAKALMSGDRARFTALAATREEMEGLLETAWPPATPEERKELKDKVAAILADRRHDFDSFQAMKKKAGFKDGAALRFEEIEQETVREKDGMKYVRHSRFRMVQPTGSGKDGSFLIKLDDMYLFPRGWAFTSVSPNIVRERVEPRRTR